MHRALLKVARSLVKIGSKRGGLLGKVARTLTSKEWADKLDKPEKELDRAMQAITSVPFLVFYP